MLKQKYPGFKQTNLTNAHYDQNTLVESGCKAVISLEIDLLKRSNLGHYSYLGYVPNDYGLCWWVGCPQVEGFGNSVNAQTNTFTVGGRKVLVWHVPGGISCLKAIDDAFKHHYPGIQHLNFEKFESYLKTL